MTAAGAALATTLTCAPFERADRRGGTRVVMRCESERALVDFDPEGLDARERDAFVRLADRGIADLERLLAPSGAVPPRTERVRYVVSRRVDMSRAYGRTVLLPLERVKSQSAPYLHETVHARPRLYAGGRPRHPRSRPAVPGDPARSGGAALGGRPGGAALSRGRPRRRRAPFLRARPLVHEVPRRPSGSRRGRSPHHRGRSGAGAGAPQRPRHGGVAGRLAGRPGSFRVAEDRALGGEVGSGPG